MANRQITTSVITGDIVQSRKSESDWLPVLKKTLSMEGKSPRVWEIFRGDSFQVEIKDPARAFFAAVRIKSAIKTMANLDVRMAIGIGGKNADREKLAESDGEAFINSGEKFETLKKVKQTLAIKTPWPAFDRDMNICFKLACIPMDDWTPNSAELVHLLTQHEGLTQTELARKLDVSQPAVSERQNRAHYDEIMELDGLYREKIQQLASQK
jgi:hypothetical protein